MRPEGRRSPPPRDSAGLDNEAIGPELGEHYSTPHAQGTGLFSAGVPGRGDALVATFLTPNE